MGDLPTNKSNQYLTLRIADESYAIPVTEIREVLVVPLITRIPRMPSFVRGIINLRGTVVPVIDLKRKFGFGETVITNFTSIIVVEIQLHETEGRVEELHLGIFADSVQKVITIDPGLIEPAPKIGVKMNIDFILGMGHIDDWFTTILNMGRILTTDDIDVVSNITSEPVNG